MGLPSAGWTGLLAAVLLVSGCGTADVPQGPPATPASASTGVARGLESESESESSVVSAAVSESALSSPSPVSADQGSPTEAAPADPPPVAATPTAAAPPVGPASSPNPVPPPAAPPPATFPDPEVVAAAGHATNPLCEVLSVDEVAALLGSAVRPAVDDAAGTGCLWSGVATDSRYAQLQMLGDPARYVRPGDAEAVTGVGDDAFVIASDGGWTAQAQNPDGTFAVRLTGAGATRAAAVEALRRLLDRY